MVPVKIWLIFTVFCRVVDTAASIGYVAACAAVVDPPLRPQPDNIGLKDALANALAETLMKSRRVTLLLKVESMLFVGFSIGLLITFHLLSFRSIDGQNRGALSGSFAESMPSHIALSTARLPWASSVTVQMVS